jgi:hypothetical protein
VFVFTEPGTQVFGDQFAALSQSVLVAPVQVSFPGQFEYPAIGSAVSSARANAFFQIDINKPLYSLSSYRTFNIKEIFPPCLKNPSLR